MKREAKCQGICNCPECTVTKVSLKTRTKRVNTSLYDLGTRYYARLGYALNCISDILTTNGFEDFGAQAVFTNKPGRFTEPVGDGKYLSVSWYIMPSGTYEVTAYVS